MAAQHTSPLSAANLFAFQRNGPVDAREYRICSLIKDPLWLRQENENCACKGKKLKCHNCDKIHYQFSNVPHI